MLRSAQASETERMDARKEYKESKEQKSYHARIYKNDESEGKEEEEPT